MPVPDRWRDYSRFHQCIDETRILAVKTPLKQSFNNGLSLSEMERQGVENGVPLEEEFTPANLIEGVAGMGHRLGLVIDLTNTHRYYNEKEFLPAGVKHEKLKCVGQQIPSHDIYIRLSEILNTFLSENKTDIAVVHCTHGLNRTGYLVCRYLIEYCGYKVEAAIKAFEIARGHKIEKYLDHLRKGCPKLPDPTPSYKGAHHSGADEHGGHKESNIDAFFYQRQSDPRRDTSSHKRRSDRGDWRGGDRGQSVRQGWDQDWRRGDNPSNGYYTNDHTCGCDDYQWEGRGRTSRGRQNRGLESDRHDLHGLEDQTKHLHIDPYYEGSDLYHSGAYERPDQYYSRKYEGSSQYYSGLYEGSDQYYSGAYERPYQYYSRKYEGSDQYHSGPYVESDQYHSGPYVESDQYHSGPYVGSDQYHSGLYQHSGSHQDHGSRSYGDSEQHKSSSYKRRKHKKDKQ